MKRLVSLMLTACLVCAVSASPVLAASAYYSDTESEHSQLDFSEMDVSGYSSDDTYAAIDALKIEIAKPDNTAAVEEAYDNMVAAVDWAATVSSIYDIDYYSNVSDEEAAERSSEMYSELNSIVDAAQIVLSEMLETEYADIFREDVGDEEADTYKDYEGMTDEEAELLNQENDLVQQYEELISSTDDQNDVYEECADIYLQLLDIRSREAELWGYDSYMEYAYETVYYRDYTPEAADTYRDLIKQYFVPLHTDLDTMTSVSSSYNSLGNIKNYSVDDILGAMEKYLPEISEELVPAFDVFTSQHLYNLEASDTKMEVGYTTSLYTYNVPFIFNCPYDNFYDYTDTFHEFGHFNSMYHRIGVHALYDISSYDLEEVSSQALELLFLEYADEIYGEEFADGDRLLEMSSMTSSVIEGCLFDEFQKIAFDQKDTLTAEGLSDLFLELAQEYGYDDLEGSYWINVSHTFESPFYYISYSTSAIAALEIYTDSLADRDAAIDSYLRVSAEPNGTGFEEALADAGLNDPMEETVIEGITNRIRSTYASEEELANAQAAVDAVAHVKSVIATVVPIVIGAVILVVAVIVIVVLKKKKNKKA